MLQIHQIASGFPVHSALQVIPMVFDRGLSSGHSFAELDLCFGLLSWWKLKFSVILSCLTEACKFCGIWIYPCFPLRWLEPQSQLMRSCPVVWYCHHHASPCVWCLLGDKLSCLCTKHTLCIQTCPKSSTLVSLDHNTICHIVWQNLVSLGWVFFPH